MPRRPRLELPGIPLHITQRGVNRAATFLDAQDHRDYLAALAESTTRHGVRVYAYVLMGNHVHLLVGADREGAVSSAMRDLGQRYVLAFNRKYGRTGTLWEGRFRSCLVERDGYLLGVYRYIELNPVRAALVERAEDHPWSSVHAHLGRADDALVAPHPVFDALGATVALRAQAYRQWLAAGVSDQELAGIRRHVRQERAWGDRRFQSMVEQTLQRPVTCRPRGRPRQGNAVETGDPFQTDIYSGPILD